jgi:hypothetical protein
VRVTVSLNSVTAFWAVDPADSDTNGDFEAFLKRLSEEAAIEE